jgi:hypothetical protein
MLEKRCHERFNIQINSHIAFHGENGSTQTKEVTTSNISSSGAFFMTSDPLPLGTQLHIEFILPITRLRKPGNNDSSITCVGTVVRQEPEGVAVSFDKGCSISPLRSTRS